MKPKRDRTDGKRPLFAEGVLHKFDQESNKKIEEFLNKETSKLQVVVTAEKSGEELNLLTIANQK
jgi:hypothetical protein